MIKEMDEVYKTVYVRKWVQRTGWSRLGKILIRIREYGKVVELYQVLVDKASSDTERGYLLESTWFCV